MLNKPIKFKMMAMLSMALIFWLSGVNLFAQNKQANSAEPEKKQVPTSQPNVSLSNKVPQIVKQNDAKSKQVESEKQAKREQAIKAKNQAIANESAAKSKQQNTEQSISRTSSTKNSQNKAISSQEWETKKAKLVESLKNKPGSLKL